jgi:hypothetical protein
VKTAEVIPVTVRLNIGSTNLARASVGARAAHASSTCDGESAARRAAAKYFRCPEAEIALTLLAQGEACSSGKIPARYMAERKGGAS